MAESFLPSCPESTIEAGSATRVGESGGKYQQLDAAKRRDEEACAQEMVITSHEANPKRINPAEVDFETQSHASASSHGRLASDEKLLGGDGSFNVDLEAGKREAESEKAGAVCSERVCRVCHMNLAKQHECGEGMTLGCNCKEDLGTAHRRCAEAWFKLKGNKVCEICGAIASNVRGIEDAEFMRNFNPQPHHPGPSPSPRWRNRQPLMNFFIAILIAALLLPWIFHFHLFS